MQLTNWWEYLFEFYFYFWWSKDVSSSHNQSHSQSHFFFISLFVEDTSKAFKWHICFADGFNGMRQFRSLFILSIIFGIILCKYTVHIPQSTFSTFEISMLMRHSNDYHGFLCVWVNTRKPVFHSSECRFLCVFLNEKHGHFVRKAQFVRLFIRFFFSAFLFFPFYSIFSAQLHMSSTSSSYMRKPMHIRAIDTNIRTAFTPFDIGHRAHASLFASHAWHTSLLSVQCTHVHTMKSVRCTVYSVHISDITHISNEMKFWVNCR